MADATYMPSVYRAQGSTKLVVASGGVIDIESGGYLKMDGTDVTGSLTALTAVTSGELAYLDTVTAGTVTAGKCVVVASTKKHVDILAMTEINVGAGTSVGVAITSADINLIDGLTAGTVAASKAVTAGAAKQINEICISNLFSGATTGGVELTSGDLTLIDGLTPGTLVASKAVTVGSAKQVNEICISNLFVGATTGGVELTSGDADLIDGVTKGTVAAGKAVVCASTKRHIDALCMTNFYLGAGTSVGYELTSDSFLTTAEGTLITGITEGTVTVGKAVVSATTKKAIDALAILELSVGAGTSAGVQLTSGDVDFIDGITAGTVAVNKAVVCASTKKGVDVLAIASFCIGAGTSAGEVTATAAELNLSDDQVASVSWTISTESAADVITITAALKDAAGSAMTRACPILFAQLADTCGTLFTAATTVGCTLTSGSAGAFIPLVAGKFYQGISSTAGSLIVSWTDTSSQVPWYPGIVLPNGKWSIGAAVECTS